MKLEIISKLEGVIKKSINNEIQVVYILTRIGKILESEKSEDSYPVLKFYRDWSVHIILDRKKDAAIIDILKEFIEKKEKRYLFSRHTQLCMELNKFLEEHNLPQLKKSKLNNFIFHLGKVLADTPIEATIDGQQYCISISKPIKKDWSGMYTISPTPCSPEGRENSARKK